MVKTEKNYIDISLPVYPGMVVWQNEDGPEIEFTSTLEEGDEANVSSIKMGVHTGTHVDAPLHFIDGGRRLDEMDLSILVGEAFVFESPAQVITADVLSRGSIPSTRRLLIKTQNNELYKKGRFEPDFTALDESAADWVLAHGIRLVGIDYLSVEMYKNKAVGHPVHKKLLGNEVMLLEGLVLDSVESGFYHLVALPLRLLGTEGAPVRAILYPAKTKL